MKTAVKSASKWLIEKASENKKLNPIPFALFQKILGKQIEWAKSQRGVTINFDELTKAVSAELLKHGIYTMSADGKRQGLLFNDTNAEPNNDFSTLTLALDDGTLTAIFGWLHSTFSKANAEGIKELRFSVSAVKEYGNV